MGLSKDSCSKNPKEEASFLSLLFISWMNNLLSIGYQRALKDDDLYGLSHDNDAEEVVEQMEDEWEDEVSIAQRKGRPPRLWRAVLKMFPWQKYIFILILKHTETAMNFILASLLWFYLKILKDDFPRYETYAIVCAVGISVFVMIRVFIGKHTDFQTKVMGMKLKIALIGIIHKKILQIQRHVLSSVTTGHIQNLVSNDVQRLEELYVTMKYLIAAPFTIVMGLIMLLFFIGWQSLSGVTILFFLGLLSLSMATKYATFRSKQSYLTDQRLGILSEIFSEIRTVKSYAWEQSFTNLIKVVRRKEIGFVIRRTIFNSLNSTIEMTINDITTLISIVTLIYAGIQVFSYDIFTLATIFGVISMCMTYNIDYCYRHIQDANVSLVRIEQFLCKSDLDFEEFSAHDTMNHGMILTRLSAAWSTGSHDVIHDITLKASPHTLMIITGPVGSGKSSLLMAIQGEIPITSGKKSCHGKKAYVSQVPWTFSGTVRDNIVFGKSFSEMRYQKILDVCELQKDMRRFPKGDLSMIGQRGIVLSGGQRSRVSLARAMYSQADIVLLDDPLSAVDAKVGQHIFEKGICGELSGSLRILVTHQVQYLRRADWIVVIKDGRIEDQGSYDELKSRGMIQQEGAIKDVAKKSAAANKETSIQTSKRKEELDDSEIRDLEEVDEEKAVGHVSWRLYWSFFRAGSKSVCLVSYVLFYLFVQGMLFAPSVLQASLANMSYNAQRSSTIIGMYVGLVSVSFGLSTLRSFLCYYLLIKSSKNLHGRIAESVIKSPVGFFDTNPTGRIMNRFSRDIGIIDDELPIKYDSTLTMSFKCLGVVFLAIVINYWLLFLIILLLILSYYVCRYYLNTSRELSRMVAIRYSPMYAHIAETIRGLEVIRTSQMEKEFVNKLNSLQNHQTKAFYLVVALNQWFALRFDLICACLIVGVAFIGVFAIKDEALTGMLLSLTISLLSEVEYALRMACDIENKMTSVERVMAYCSLPVEPGYSRKKMKTENWPNQGMLRLQDVSLRYVEGGVRVLSGVNLLIQPREKIGIVGRTGAGKSSLVAAILRMPEPEGQVFIDGVDLGTIDIQAARTSIAVISQDPVLFAGSLRRTLDPFNRFTDQQIWTALEEVQLRDTVYTIPGQLDYRTGEYGTGFSAGQRQLLCLARALLERRQIMIMDEATSNVDYKTDQLIQRVIRHKFSKRTVLTIAHRINTIMDYDKVIVMDRGRVIEYDTPAVLAGKKDSRFYELLQNQR